MARSTYKENLDGIDWSIKMTIPPRKAKTRYNNRSAFATPRIVGDYAPYECPVSGKMIEGRVAHEENLKRTGCRLLEKGEKEDNTKRAQKAAEKQDREMERAIDGIVDSVAKDYY